MLRIIADYICKLMHDPLFLGYSLLLFFFIDKKKWNRVVAIFFLGCTTNVILKCVFKIPLPENVVHNWYAFPSGHMQFQTIYLGALALELSKGWSLIASFLLISGWSMWFMGYHILFDLAGGFIVGACILALHQLLCKKTSEKNQIYFGFVFGCIALLLLLLSIRTRNYHWGPIGGLFGLGFGMLLSENFIIVPHKTSLLLKLFVGTIGVGVMKFLTDYFCNNPHSEIYWFTIYFLSILWISYGVEAISYLMTSKIRLNNRMLLLFKRS